MDTNTRGVKSLGGRMILFILFIIAAVMFYIQSVPDWVAGDIQGRLVPATAVLVVPFVFALLVYTFREGSKPRRHIR